MIFRDVEGTEDNKYYARFMVDMTGLYSIGLLHELFKRYKIQVMYRSSVNGQWWVIKEYVTYDNQMLLKQMMKIHNGLRMLQPEAGDERAIKYGGLVWWQVVDNALPVNKYKYLEDELLQQEEQAGDHGKSSPRKRSRKGHSNGAT